MTVGEADRDRKALFRAGGISAIALGLSYLVITALYVSIGAEATEGAQAWLEYIDGNTTEWWAIVGLSALTDVLFLPVTVALYEALRAMNRTAMLIGAGLLALFAVLDLAITQTSFASLITLSGEYAAATSTAERAASVAAASYPSSVIGSGLFAVYVILVPALGILVIGLVMLNGAFGQVAAYVGVLTGMLGIVAVAGPYVWSPLGSVVILTSLLTTIWIFLVGYRLVRVSQL